MRMAELHGIGFRLADNIFFKKMLKQLFLCRSVVILGWTA